ncbi:glycosyltransferase family 4 protein [Haliea sp. E17]|uniref:glycosyltransferase family 4 protein n=1 Tax=Haliea sp. E17 TaxID=3401576 RepID=UPI003AB0444B
MKVLYLYSFLFSLLITLALMPLLIRYSGRFKLVDDPAGSERKLHDVIVPRSGGLGIIAGASLSLLILLPLDLSLSSYLISCMLIIGFGLWDDFSELRPAQKLFGQAIGVIVAMSGGMVIGDLPLLPDSPAWFCNVVTFVFVLGVINGVNFSDGMDGLAAGTTFAALILLFILAIQSSNSQVAAVSISVMAALVGFLRFNTHPASIFMGDAGSQFLGFTLAWLSITVSQNAMASYTPLLPLIILGIPVMDILQVVPVRIRKKLPLPGPDREHFHHQIAKLGFYHYEVVALIYFLQAILLCSAYLLRFSSDVIAMGFYILFVSLILGILYVGHKTGWRAHDSQEINDRGYRRNIFFRRLSFLHPYTGKIVGLFIAGYFFLAAGTSIFSGGSLAYLSLALGVFLLLPLPIRVRWPVGWGRLASYLATIILSYSLIESVAGKNINLLIDGGLVVLILLLALSIRITRRTYFGANTEDLLVVLSCVFLAPFLLADMSQITPVIRYVFRIFVLFYACEYLLARGEKTVERITVVAAVALLLNGLHLFMHEISTSG